MQYTKPKRLRRKYKVIDPEILRSLRRHGHARRRRYRIYNGTLYEVTFAAPAPTYPLPSLVSGTDYPADNPAAPVGWDTFNPPGSVLSPSGSAPAISAVTPKAGANNAFAVAGWQFTNIASGMKFQHYGQTTGGNGILSNATIPTSDWLDTTNQVANIVVDSGQVANSALMLWPSNANGIGLPIVINKAISENATFSPKATRQGNGNVVAGDIAWITGKMLGDYWAASPTVITIGTPNGSGGNTGKYVVTLPTGLNFVGGDVQNVILNAGNTTAGNGGNGAFPSVQCTVYSYNSSTGVTALTPIGTTGRTDTVLTTTVTNGGSGYSIATAVAFSAPSSGVTATGTPVLLNGVVTGIKITNPGSGYTSAPSITISDTGGGTSATATANSAWEVAQAWLYLDGYGWVTPTAISSTCIGYTVPSFSGTKNLWPHNGHGGQYGWGAPLPITSVSADNWGANIVALSDYPTDSSGQPNSGLDITNALLWAKNTMGASEVTLEAGTYLLGNNSGTQNNFGAIYLKGAGQSLTFLQDMGQTYDYFWQSIGGRISDMTVDIRGASFSQGNGGAGILGPVYGENITFKVSPVTNATYPLFWYNASGPCQYWNNILCYGSGWGGFTATAIMRNITVYMLGNPGTLAEAVFFPFGTIFNWLFDNCVAQQYGDLFVNTTNTSITVGSPNDTVGGQPAYTFTMTSPQPSPDIQINDVVYLTGYTNAAPNLNPARIAGNVVAYSYPTVSIGMTDPMLGFWLDRGRGGTGNNWSFGSTNRYHYGVGRFQWSESGTTQHAVYNRCQTLGNNMNAPESYSPSSNKGENILEEGVGVEETLTPIAVGAKTLLFTRGTLANVNWGCLIGSGKGIGQPNKVVSFSNSTFSYFGGNGGAGGTGNLGGNGGNIANDYGGAGGGAAGGPNGIGYNGGTSTGPGGGGGGGSGGTAGQNVLLGGGNSGGNGGNSFTTSGGPGGGSGSPGTAGSHGSGGGGGGFFGGAGAAGGSGIDWDATLALAVAGVLAVVPMEAMVVTVVTGAFMEAAAAAEVMELEHRGLEVLVGKALLWSVTKMLRIIHRRLSLQLQVLGQEWSRTGQQ